MPCSRSERTQGQKTQRTALEITPWGAGGGKPAQPFHFRGTTPLVLLPWGVDSSTVTDGYDGARSSMIVPLSGGHTATLAL